MAIALAGYVLSAGTPRLLATMPDDAAYFFQIAARASAGEGLTFDGINPTNGFQPLWLAVLVLAHAICRGAPEAMLRVFLLLQIALLTTAAVLTNGLVSRFFSRPVAFLTTVVFVFAVFVPAVNGMESALLVTTLAVAAAYAGRRSGLGLDGLRPHFVLGVLLGTVVLARLDAVFVPAVAACGYVARIVAGRDTRRDDARRLACMAGGVALVVGPYLAFNLASFGAAMPISGTLKSSFPAISFSGSLPSELDRRARVALVLAAAYLVWFAVRSRELRKDPSGRLPYQRLVAVAAGAVLLHFLHTILFMEWAVFYWHFIPYALVATAIASEPLQLALRVTPAALRVGACVSLVGAVLVLESLRVIRTLDHPLDRSWSVAAYDAARWARRSTPEGAVFAMSDCGNFGYYSSRRTINLDGLVNSFDYQRVLRDRDLGAYLARCGAGYIAHHAFWNRPDILSGAYEPIRLSYRSRLYDAYSDEVVVTAADEVYRSRPYFDGPYETVFLVWKLPVR